MLVMMAFLAVSWALLCRSASYDEAPEALAAETRRHDQRFMLGAMGVLCVLAFIGW